MSMRSLGVFSTDSDGFEAGQVRYVQLEIRILKPSQKLTPAAPPAARATIEIAIVVISGAPLGSGLAPLLTAPPET